MWINNYIAGNLIFVIIKQYPHTHFLYNGHFDGVKPNKPGDLKLTFVYCGPVIILIIIVHSFS